jgi:hypothetical protein
MKVVRATAVAACWVGALALNAGCATAPQTLYAWGSYEDLIYAVHAKPGALSPETQADMMEKDRQAANAGNRRLPPGWHAHLAALYAQTGRADLAHQELLAEKSAFPESAVLVDRLLANLDGRKP